ncbi:DUF6443 domain-containing protein [Paraflavitalea sp. CAU 1676]|nr:DUF6443 domain-containing protein [Paraflavitalea sp. CAU 1676]
MIPATAQFTINGTSCVIVGKEAYFNISGYSSSATMEWCITGSGTILQAYGSNITGNGTCKSGTAVGSIVVRWDSPGTGSVSLTSSEGTAPNLIFTIIAALGPGAISSNKNQTIPYNSTPATIGCSAATNGACSPVFNYQWQSSTDNSYFTDMPGSTVQQLPFSSSLITTTYFRRKVTETTTNTVGYSDVATVIVAPPFSSVTIAPATQHIFAGDAASSLSGPAASGGSCAGDYKYQWESSPDGNNWQDITNAKSLTYAPGTPGVTTYYRRRDECGAEKSFSNTLVVYVHQHLNAGALSPATKTISYNRPPGIPGITQPSGGMCQEYVTQWQVSNDNVSFQDFTGSFTDNLINTTYFRRKITCGSEIAYTNSLTVIVNPPVDPGNIDISLPAIPINTSPGQLITTTASGGACNNLFQYQWQQSTDGNIFSDIPGATTQHYTPGNLAVSTWFRRRVNCSIDELFTRAIKVSVQSGLLTYNYIQTRDINKPGITDELTASQLTNPEDVKQVTQYFDGLGRPIQSVSKQATPLGKDIIDPTVYDPFGRESVKYLAYASTASDGKFRQAPITESQAFHSVQFPGEQYYYSRNIFEASPVAVKTASFPEGLNWTGSRRGTATRTWSNTPLDQVRIWTVTDVANNLGTYATTSTYLPGSLIKTVTIDEDNKQIIEYKDFEGKTILKKIQHTAAADNGAGSGYNGWLCTYNIYDIYGSLRCVIQPGGVQTLSGNGWDLNANGGTLLQEQCFRFEYDHRDRNILKKIPGSGIESSVYDKRDRVVFTQTANMQANNQWMGSLYDALNRNIQTFMLTYSGTRADLQTYVTNNTGAGTITNTTTNGSSATSIPAYLMITRREIGRTSYQASQWISFEGNFDSEPGAQFVAEIVADGPANFSNLQAVHDNPVPPGATVVALTMTSFDDYSATSRTYNTANNSKLDKGSNPYAEVLPAAASFMTRGAITSIKVRAIEDPGNLAAGKWQETVTFYDNKQRAIQVQTVNYKGGLNQTTQLYNPSGQLLCTYELHNNASGNMIDFPVKTNRVYDAAGRLLSVRKTLLDDNNPTAPSTTQRILASYVYDAMGQLKEKKIGQKTASGSAPLTAAMETQVHDYNIRGWLLGINRDYVKNVGNNYFGFELGYDKSAAIISGSTYNNPSFNGHISGTIWKSAGDGERRKYDFAYDGARRLTAAAFTQFTGNSFNLNANIDYSVSNITYDGNGNLKTMQQNGWKFGGSTPIDNLTYSYIANGNRLKNVAELINDPLSKAGDFKYSSAYTNSLPGGQKNEQTEDYLYDNNGNITLDKNKDITSIIYNHLNLPCTITIAGKGTITYIYDAVGHKLEKRTQEPASALNNYTEKQTTTSYLGNFTYENNQLQYILQEEGKIRPVQPTAYNNSQKYAYDYTLKDHLGNVRAVLTDELAQLIYPATTLEGSFNNAADAVFIEKGYYNINEAYIVNKPASLTDYPNHNGNPPYNNNPNSNTTALSTRVYKLNGNTNKTGLGIALKVMAGDKVNIFGKSWYSVSGSIQGPPNAVPVLELLSAFATSVPMAGKGISGANLSGNAPLVSGITNLLQGQDNQTSTQAKAFINWIILDEQFNYVSGGFDKVGTNGTLKNHNNTTIPDVTVTKNGYIFVYCSNESNLDVYFDNLQLIHTKGPLVEESHYYPFGLTMAGISSRAAGMQSGKHYFNGKEKQHLEFSDDTGLEWYDFGARMYDPQIGRWHSTDPLAHATFGYSPYNFTLNNPVNLIDPDGRIVIDPTLSDQEQAALRRIVNETRLAIMRLGQNSRELRALLALTGFQNRSDLINFFRVNNQGPTLTTRRLTYGTGTSTGTGTGLDDGQGGAAVMGQMTPSATNQGVIALDQALVDVVVEGIESERIKTPFGAFVPLQGYLLVNGYAAAMQDALFYVTRVMKHETVHWGAYYNRPRPRSAQFNDNITVGIGVMQITFERGQLYELLSFGNLGHPFIPATSSNSWAIFNKFNHVKYNVTNGRAILPPTQITPAENSALQPRPLQFNLQRNPHP